MHLKHYMTNNILADPHLEFKTPTKTYKAYFYGPFKKKKPTNSEEKTE